MLFILIQKANLFFFKANKSDWVVVDNNDDGFASNTSSFLSSTTTQGPSVQSMESRSKYSSSSTSTSSSTINNNNNGDASKRFANAKSISSAQYFGNSNMSEVFFLSLELSNFRTFC